MDLGERTAQRLLVAALSLDTAAVTWWIAATVGHPEFVGAWTTSPGTLAVIAAGSLILAMVGVALGRLDLRGAGMRLVLLGGVGDAVGSAAMIVGGEGPSEAAVVLLVLGSILTVVYLVLMRSATVERRPAVAWRSSEGGR